MYKLYIAFFECNCYNHNVMEAKKMLEKLKINKKLLKELDYSVIIICLIIAFFGALNIYSATHLKSGISVFKSQLVWIALGLIVTYFMIVIDYSLI